MVTNERPNYDLITLVDNETLRSKYDFTKLNSGE